MRNSLVVKSLYTATLLLLFSFLALANADFCQKALATFEAQQSTYREGMCCDNIYYLVEKLHQRHPEIPLSESEILYIYSRWSGDFSYIHKHNYFIPLRSLSESLPRWGFHVVFKYSNTIYDFDYGPEAAGIEIREYFKTMFGAHWNSTSERPVYEELDTQNFSDSDLEFNLATDSILKLHVRSIPASTYLDSYAPFNPIERNPLAKNYKYWLMNLPDLPDQPLEDYLWKLSPLNQ